MMIYLSRIQYSLYLVFHPFDGFWDLKEERRGSLGAAITIVTGLILTYILRRQYTAFLFNFNNIQELNVVLEVLSVLIPFLLWSLASWCLTSLADGEGTFKEIVIATAYSLTPLIIINLPLTIVSHFLSLDEAAFYYFFTGVSILWSAGLLFFGTLVTHQYSLKKNFLTIIGILLGMAIMIFIALLFASVVQQILEFFSTVYKEIMYR